MPRPAPWYADGLRFECTGCGDCCGGKPGAVWLNEAEEVALAEHLELSQAHFRSHYVRQLHGRSSLAERPSGDCIFLDSRERRCTVYAARPVQCRSWPFWPANVRTEEDWRATEGECPGAGKGDVVPLAEIDVQLVALVRARRS